jgi:hypothetical protein
MLVVVIPGTDNTFGNNHKQIIRKQHGATFYGEIQSEIDNREHQYNGHWPTIFPVPEDVDLFLRWNIGLHTVFQ